MLKNLSSSIKRKIVKFQNISSIKKKHKNEKVILCHGVFDVVHPGHLRHFLFAKSKADILVVSCTSDQYINKGIYRPHVPEKLRAFNLAVLEMIDYVIIDNAKKPLSLIKKLKPNFLQKVLSTIKYQSQMKPLKKRLI